MTKTENQESERIAEELERAHRALVGCGQEGIDGDSLETWTLAKAVQMFSGRLEADLLNAEQRAIRAFTEAL